MSEKTYGFWTTLCLVIAVASAFLFDKAGHLSWLVGAAGVAAAVVAVSIYFYNSGSEPQPAQREYSEPQQTVATYVDLVGVDQGSLLNRTGQEQLALWSLNLPELELSKEDIAVYVHALKWPEYVAPVAMHYWNYVDHPREVRQAGVFVNEVVEIVERLSNICEFELNLGGGGLIIRPRSMHATESAFESESTHEREARREQIH
jgi:hypothetical protein